MTRIGNIGKGLWRFVTRLILYTVVIVAGLLLYLSTFGLPDWAVRRIQGRDLL